MTTNNVATLGNIEIAKIRVAQESLRDVNKTSPEFQEFAANIKNNGVLLPIRVAREKDAITGEESYLLIDGLQRFTGAQLAGFKTIPANIQDEISPLDFLREQFMLNIMRFDTKPVEYARQLDRMLKHDPSLTVVKLATMIGKSETYIKERLNLVNLSNEIATLVDNNNLNLVNAKALSKLDVDDQADFIERAQQLTSSQFVPLVDEHIREKRKAMREGRSASPTFTLIAKIRKEGEVEEEIASGKARAALFDHKEPESAEEGFALALSWVLGLDPITEQDKRDKWQQEQDARAEKKKNSESERAAKREQANSLKAQRMQYSLELQGQGLSAEEIAHKLVDWDVQHNLLK